LENKVKNREISEGNERGGIPNRNILWYKKNGDLNLSEHIKYS
jgi:hypothetical protein